MQMEVYNTHNLSQMYLCIGPVPIFDHYFNYSFKGVIWCYFEDHYFVKSEFTLFFKK